MTVSPISITMLLIGLSGTILMGAEPSSRDVVYGQVGGHKLLLDVYQPSPSREPLLKNQIGNPVIVWVHGGAWRSGSKQNVPITRLLDHGFAITSVDYRLSPVAKFPAQVRDIKAAIRFLRGNAERFRINPAQVFIAGSSAGGHLATLVGTSHGVRELEGNVGEFASESSQAQRIVSFFGAADLRTILSQSTSHGLSVRVPALQLLLGGQPDEKPDLARLASPAAHVDAHDPPLLLIHGDADPQMPIRQSIDLQEAYKQVQRTSRNADC